MQPAPRSLVTTKLLDGLCLSIFVLSLAATSLTATNPEYNGVGIVDGLIMGSSLLALSRFAPGLTHSSPLRTGIILLMTALLALSVRWGVEAYLYPTAGMGWCGRMPAYAPKIECMLHLSFNENPGLRQLVFHLTALGGCIAAYVMARALQPKVVLKALLLPHLLWVSGHLLGHFGILKQTLVGFNLIQPHNYLMQGGSAIIANSGWLWTLLLPGLCASLALAVSSRGWTQKILVVHSLLTAIAIFSARARGGYLALAVLVLCLGLRWALLRSSQSRSQSLSLAAISMAGLLLISYWQPVVRFFGVLLHVPFKDGAFVSNERLAMWRFAWQGIQQHPLFGHGVGSWHREFRGLALERPDIVYDTAHNLFVQMFFELGILHGLLCLGLLGFMMLVLLGWRRPFSLGRVPLYCIFFGAMSVLVLLVQEIDYVNAVYYQFAIFAGVALAISQSAQGTPQRREPRWTWQRRFYSGAALTVVGLSLLGVLQFSLGGYAFEIPRGQVEVMQRWFRPRGQLVAFQTREKAEYSVMPVLHWISGGIQFDQQDAAYRTDTALILRNGSKLWGERYTYSTGDGTPEIQRRLAFATKMPPYQSNLLITKQQGLSAYEPVKAGSLLAGRRCLGDCTLILKALPCAGRQQLQLHAAQPLLMQSALRVTIDVRPLANSEAKVIESAGVLAAADWERLGSGSLARELSGNDLGKGVSLSLPEAENWVLRLHSNQEQSLTAGTGKLALTDLSCQPG